MKSKVVCYYGSHAEKRKASEGRSWIVLPMGKIRGQSEREMAEKWKDFIIELCGEVAPDLLEHQKKAPEKVAERSPWFLYWLLPQILRTGTKSKRRDIWVQDYDLPLLSGLKGGFGRYSTELVSGVAEACTEVLSNVSCLYFTGQLPFPLYRIGLGEPQGKGIADDGRREDVRCILREYFQKKGKESWKEWLEYFSGKKNYDKMRLSTEEISNVEQWKALAYYTQLESEIPALIRDLLGEEDKPLISLHESRWSREVWRMIYRTANRWNCDSIEEMEELLQILVFCQEPECGQEKRKRGRPSPHRLVFVNDQPGGTKMQVKLSVKN